MDPDSHSALVLGRSPAGDIGNHVAPQAIIIVTGIMVAIALLIRFLARYLMKKLGIAEVLLVISMGFYIFHHYNAYQVAVYPGLGVHEWQYNPELAASSNYSWRLGSVTFGINIAFLKVAILLDWIHTFVPDGTRNSLFWILTTLIVTNSIFYFIGTFIEAFQCPTGEMTISTCNIDVTKYNIASGIINVISDLTILIAPHWVIWRLRLSTPRKIGISLLFTIGGLAIGSAIARVVYVAKAYDTGDVVYYSVIINLWAVAEQTFGYLVICVPAIPKVIKDFPCAVYLGSLARSKVRQSSIEHGSTWPGSTSWRRNRTPWEARGTGEMDTHVLVTVLDGAHKDVPLPDRVRVYGEPQTTNVSRDEIGVPIPISDTKLV
ncbi:hypothetical protein O1611_g2346 [Lasiodiplodia mahajangana]|uniref:Uncharacterized protein n=1 Tax=Lasiodiplodia mahajangana TaxID=1108764 RepID=A0ACC2JVI2_9PEZI|nr:hypothetical protein O1611_g2346 [Lasiodiplodia mahajangana]